jgi:hypothetical protein
MEQIETEINNLNLKIDAIEQLLDKEYEEWTVKEKRKFGNHEQLRNEKEQLRNEKEQLRKKEEQLRNEKEQLRNEKEQLRELLILKEKEKQSQITAGTAMDIDIRPFDSAIYQSRNNRYFPFFDPDIEEYLKHFGENALLARDDVINQVNHIISRRIVEKYQPILCSTSRGMGKTAFMEAIGMQLVKPHLKNQLIMDALAYGRILSFDFASADARTAMATQEEDIETFFTRLMIYFLCRMFDGTQVDGIYFKKISQFATVTTIIGSQRRFEMWLKNSLKLNADDMMDEYIRLTNLAFGVSCMSPPVFLLDEIQVLLRPTTVSSTFKNDQVVYHSFLSLLLTQLAGKHKPVCICTGTNSGNIIFITEKSRMVPRFVSLSTLHKEEDYKTFWKQRTEYMNVTGSQSAIVTDQDEEMVNSLVYASYQIPRLLLLAHLAWLNHKTNSHLTDRIVPLQIYENDAIQYYSEMAEILFNPQFTGNDIPHILLCCGVHWEVRDINSCVPGTTVLWADLISMSLVFPYLDNCYIIPFRLMWAAKTPINRQKGDYTKTRAGIVDSCKLLIPNFDINNLFVSYDNLRQLNLYNLGMCYESLFASSLAVKYYLCKLEHPNQSLFSILDIYDVGKEDAKTLETLSDIYVDFSFGMFLPEQEASVDQNLPSAVIHNCKTHNAHHDIILPASEGNIVVSCKASFNLSSDKTIQSQLKKSKTNDESVRLLMWLYLGNHPREEQYKNVVFINGSGCCNGLTMDMFILIKKLISQNNK